MKNEQNKTKIQSKKKKEKNVSEEKCIATLYHINRWSIIPRLKNAQNRQTSSIVRPLSSSIHEEMPPAAAAGLVAVSKEVTTTPNQNSSNQRTQTDKQKKKKNGRQIICTERVWQGIHITYNQQAQNKQTSKKGMNTAKKKKQVHSAYVVKKTTQVEKKKKRTNIFKTKNKKTKKISSLRKVHSAWQQNSASETKNTHTYRD
ncbi:hypothetical protein TCSYLVIO_004740 [Trypanosoma cruzi]|nr:hypothetical protein TCSYLVIO_004740 [Trypanosoma cruzi]